MSWSHDDRDFDDRRTVDHGSVPCGEPSLIDTGTPTYASYARSIVKARSRLRSRLDPDMFGDPAFDMLLELFAESEEGRTPSLKNIALVTDLPMSTALRWIRLLEARGLVERASDVRDRRRTLLRMSTKVEETLRCWLRETSSIPLRRH